MPRTLLLLMIDCALASCATSVDVGGFGATYNTPASSDLGVDQPPSPLTKPPAWPSRYEGGSFGITGHIPLEPDHNIYDRTELSLGRSVSDVPEVSVGAASFEPGRTHLVGVTTTLGIEVESKPWSYLVGVGLGMIALGRELDEADGHGHTFSPSMWSQEFAVTPTGSVCHSLGAVSSGWSVRLCGFLAGSVQTAFDGYFGRVGASTGLRIEAEWWPQEGPLSRHPKPEFEIRAPMSNAELPAECQEYQRRVAVLLTCDKLPEDTRARTVSWEQTYLAGVRTASQLEPTTFLEDNCRDANGLVDQIKRAFGC